MEQLYNAYLQAAACLLLSICSLSASQSMVRHVCANALQDEHNEIRYSTQVFLVDELNNPLFAYRQSDNEEYPQPVFRKEEPGSAPLVESWRHFDEIPVAEVEILDEELEPDVRLAKNIVVMDGRSCPVEHDKVKVLLRKHPVVCRLPKMHCMNPRKHRDHKVFFCVRCDKQCPLCVERCESCEGKLTYCWNHPDRTAYCKACYGECPIPHEVERVNEEFQCTSCHEYKTYEEKVIIDSCECDRDALCSTCFDNQIRSVETSLCPSCTKPLAARFECLVCCVVKAGSERVLFDSCQCNVAVCTSCTVDLVNHGEGCLTCRRPISYPKCAGCRRYLGQEQHAIAYRCTQQPFFGDPTHTLHRFHPECFKLHPYKSVSGKVVTRCQLHHVDDDTWLEDFEVALTRIKGLNVDLDTLEVAEKPGWLVPNGCAICHKQIAEGEAINHLCGKKKDKRQHTYHMRCIYDFVEQHAVKINGGAGFYCPVSHGYQGQRNNSNAKRFCTLIDRLDCPLTPDRLKTCCPLCKEPLEEELSCDVATYDCTVRNRFPWQGVQKQRYLIHVRCLSDFLTQLSRVETKWDWHPKWWWIKWWIKKLVYPCPYHYQTTKRHIVEVPYEEQAYLLKLFEEE